MLVKSDPAREKEIVAALIEEDAELKQKHFLFKEEMRFKQELIDARKANKFTQKDISERSGLSQQAVSRLEKGAGGTVETIIRYLNAIGCSLTLKANPAWTSGQAHDQRARKSRRAKKSKTFLQKTLDVCVMNGYNSFCQSASDRQMRK